MVVETRLQRQQSLFDTPSSPPPYEEGDPQHLTESESETEVFMRLHYNNSTPAEQLYFSIIRSDVTAVQTILHQHPQVLSTPITSECLAKCINLFWKYPTHLPSLTQRLHNYLISEQFEECTSLPLHWACFLCEFDIVKVLVEMYPQAVSIKTYPDTGASATGIVSNGPCKLPLHLCLESTQYDIADAIEYFDDAAHADIVTLLLSIYPDAISSTYTIGEKVYAPLDIAVESNLPEAIDILLDKLYDEERTVRNLVQVLNDFVDYKTGTVLTLLRYLALENFSILFDKLMSEDHSHEDARKEGNDEDSNCTDSKLVWEKRDGTIFSLFYDKLTGVFQEVHPSHLEKILKGTIGLMEDMPVLQHAIGSVPLDIVQYIMDAEPTLAVNCCRYFSSPLTVVLERGSAHPDKWEAYFKPIFDVIVTKNERLYESVFMSEDHSRSNFWTLHHKHEGGRHILHEAAELGLPWDGIERIISADVDALNMKDEVTGLLPFMVAAAGQSSLTSIFELFKQKPDVLDMYASNTMSLTCNAAEEGKSSMTSASQEETRRCGKKRKMIE